MGYKQYVNNLHKELQLGKHVKFRGGFFETGDRKLQELIESNNQFGTSIHFKDSLEEMERLSRVREAKEATERAALRKRVLAEVAAEEKADADRRDAEKVRIKEERAEAERVREAQRRADEATEEEGQGRGKRGAR